MFWFSQPSGDRSVTPLSFGHPWFCPPVMDFIIHNCPQPWCAIERHHGVLTTVTTWTALPADVPWASAHQQSCLSRGRAGACLPLWPVTRFPYTEPQSHSRYTSPSPWQGIWPQGLPTAQLCVFCICDPFRSSPSRLSLGKPCLGSLNCSSGPGFQPASR